MFEHQHYQTFVGLSFLKVRISGTESFKYTKYKLRILKSLTINWSKEVI